MQGDRSGCAAYVERKLLNYRRVACAAAELAAAKESWTREFATALASDDFIAGAFVEDLFLGRTLAWRRELDARIQQVTADDLVRVAHARLALPDLIVVQAGDMAKTAP